LFATIGVPQLEVFHVDTGLIYVTEGLVKQCKSDAELAAVLAIELGKMIAEREARTSADVRSSEKMAPIRVGIGNNAQGRESDMTAMAELGRFENTNPKSTPRLPRPDPMKLARGYLEKAGYKGSELDAVGPLLQEADKNVTLERHFKGAMPQSPWTP
jgi:predicted Zn-dependent protease